MLKIAKNYNSPVLKHSNCVKCVSLCYILQSHNLNFVSFSSSSNSESRTHNRAEDDDEEEYRQQLADKTRKGYYNPQKYNDTEL